MNLCFVHGWSGTPRIWKELALRLPQTSKTYIDLGYTGAVKDHTDPGNTIFITHSLGTLWALKYKRAHMKALIAINGFTSFAPFASPRVLETMKRRLLTNPQSQMSEFWLSADAKETPPVSMLKVNHLIEGLDWLAMWDETQALAQLDIPVLALAGQEDQILPLAKMTAHWQGYAVEVNPEGGHSMPQTHPTWCAEKINEFLNAANLEK